MTEPQSRTVAAQQRQVLAQEIATLLVEGCSISKIAEDLKTSRNRIYRILKEFPGAMKEVQEQRLKMAQSELMPNLKKAVEIRDQGSAREAVKAIQVIERMAGVSYQETPGGVNINIFGDNANISAMSGPQMDAIIKALAKDLGPETERVIDVEFAVRGASGEGEGPQGR